MLLFLFFFVFTFLTAVADQNDINPGFLTTLDDDGFVSDIVTDANPVVDLNDVPDEPSDSIADDLCAETPSSESFHNSDTAFNQAGIDNPEKSRRDLAPDGVDQFRTPISLKQPVPLCRVRGKIVVPPELQEHPSGIQLPPWAKKCQQTWFHFSLCCAGEHTPKPSRKRIIQSSFNVKKCIQSRLCFAFTSS